MALREFKKLVKLKGIETEEILAEMEKEEAKLAEEMKKDAELRKSVEVKKEEKKIEEKKEDGQVEEVKREVVKTEEVKTEEVKKEEEDKKASGILKGKLLIKLLTISSKIKTNKADAPNYYDNIDFNSDDYNGVNQSLDASKEIMETILFNYESYSKMSYDHITKTKDIRQGTIYEYL